MQWSADYEVGDQELDREHRALFDAISILEHSLGNVGSVSELQLLLGRLSNYMRVHFGIEEDSMREALYPDIEHHMAQHRGLLARLDDWRSQPITAERSKEIAAYVSQWGIGHIQESDHKLGRYLLAMTHL